MQSLSQLNSFPFDSGKSISTWGKTPGYRNWKYSVKLDTGCLLFALSALLATSLCSAPRMLREADWMDVSGFPHSSQVWTMGNPSRRLGAQRKESELRVVPCLVPSLWGCLMLDVSVNQRSPLAPIRVVLRPCFGNHFLPVLLSWWIVKVFLLLPPLPCYPFHSSLSHTCLYVPLWISPPQSLCDSFFLLGPWQIYYTVII